MKKLLVLLLVISIGINIYQLREEKLVKDTFEDEIVSSDRVTVAQSAIKPKCGPAKEKIIYKCPNEIENEIEEGLVSSAQSAIQPVDEQNGIESKPGIEMVAFEKFYSKWKGRRDEFLEFELGFSPDKVQRYNEILELRSQEISEALSDKIAEYAKEYGEGASYPLQPADMMVLGQINYKYESELKDLFGEADYEEYSRFRRNFNTEQGSEKNFIEF